MDTALHEMRADGVPIFDAIKFVRVEQGVDLGEAKTLVSQLPAYVDIHLMNEPLHDEVIGYLNHGLLDLSED